MSQQITAYAIGNFIGVGALILISTAFDKAKSAWRRRNRK